LHPGLAVVVFGKPTDFNGKISMSHPEIEVYNPSAKKLGNLSLQPVYNSTEKLKQNQLDSKGIQKLLENLTDLPISLGMETIPEYILKKYNLISRAHSLKGIHFPLDQQELDAAIRRLKFEELFFIQLKLLRNKLLRTEKFKGCVFEKAIDPLQGAKPHQLHHAGVVTKLNDQTPGLLLTHNFFRYNPSYDLYKRQTSIDLPYFIKARTVNISKRIII